MTSAHTGEDDIAFFAADIGYTYELAVSTVVGSLAAELGALPPGRYLIQARGMTAGSVVWVHFDRFQADAPNPTNPTGHGTQRIPLFLAGVVAFETNVLKSYNDRISAVVNTGTATLYITRVSRSA